METPTKHEQFRVIKCAFRKYTTLSAGTASVSGQQTVFDGASNHKRSSMGRVIAVPGRGVLSLWSFSAIPAGVSVYFLHFCNQYSSFVSLFMLCPSLFVKSVVAFVDLCKISHSETIDLSLYIERNCKGEWKWV